MGGINIKRLLLGGLVAGVVVFAIEGAASVTFMDEMAAQLEVHNLSMDYSAKAMATACLVSLILGFVLVFFYAAARPRFGPGPKTAVLVGVVFWFGGYLIWMLGFTFIDLYSNSMLVKWGVIGLVEQIMAALAGAWVYRED